jgi:methyl-accepting chemotaxis protein
MFHVLDEARERAEKISEEAEKYAPKTPEERLEDMIEEATGVDKDAGMLAEAMDELEEIAEEMTEETVEELDEMSEELEEVENTDQTQAEMEAAGKISTGVLPEKYKRIDYRI